MIEGVTGNLLSAQTDALVNAVNCEGVMGKGIALQFKQAWPAMFKAYRAACKAGAVVPGQMHVWPTQAPQGPRFIISQGDPSWSRGVPTPGSGGNDLLDGGCDPLHG